LSGIPKFDRFFGPTTDHPTCAGHIGLGDEAIVRCARRSPPHERLDVDLAVLGRGDKLRIVVRSPNARTEQSLATDKQNDREIGKINADVEALLNDGVVERDR